ncbi:hypothetical protein [Janthinobacterium tructae]|uniref:hypothetical protein n=1 Tax=Janthinobacterium tructae TaxID=2590869 RepID=UPI00249A40CF|nr:hypothetical protein [Janthinobacterium tructae]MDI3293963.1 hypothetical protein [Janthinobacterium tructae]
MLKIIGTLTTFLIFAGSANAANIKCGVKPSNAVFLQENLMYDVAGTGRLYLHTGPDGKCVNKSLFVVPGDSLIAYNEYGGDSEWSYVMYVAKDGTEFNGWVLTNRLRFTGASGPNMSQDAVTFYQRAAEAAKKGKLGSPK